LDEGEDYMKNYANRGDLHNSSYHAKAEFSNWLIIHSKYLQQSNALSQRPTIFHVGLKLTSLSNNCFSYYFDSHPNVEKIG